MSIKDRLVLAPIERDRLLDLQEALGLSDMEWNAVMESPSATEMETKLAEYLGIARIPDPAE